MKPPLLRRFQNRISEEVDRLLGRDLLDAAVLLTLLTFLLHPGHVWYLIVPVRILVLAALIHPRLGRTAAFWFLLMAVHAYVQNYMHWYTSDNHRFLMSYWCLALGCSLSLREGAADTIRTNARGLLGLVMLFASLRKLLAAEFVTGKTMHYLLLTDFRFREVASVLGGANLSEFPHSQMRALQPAIDIPSTPQLELVIQVLTWWTLIIEVILGVLFLIAKSNKTHLAANWTLIYFICAVYLIAPVLGFATMLCVLGYCQCPSELKRTRLFYLLAIPGLQVVSTPHMKLAIFELIDKMMN